MTADTDEPLAPIVVIDGKEYIPRTDEDGQKARGLEDDRQTIEHLEATLASAKEVADQVPGLCNSIDSVCEAAMLVLRLVRVPGNGTGDEPREIVDLRTALRDLQNATDDAQLVVCDTIVYDTPMP